MKFASWRTTCADVFHKHGLFEHEYALRNPNTTKTELGRVLLSEDTMASYLTTCASMNIENIDAFTSALLYVSTNVNWWMKFFNRVDSCAIFSSVFERIKDNALKQNLYREWIRNSISNAVPLIYSRMGLPTAQTPNIRPEELEVVLTKLHKWDVPRTFAYVQTMHCWTVMGIPPELKIQSVLDMLKEHSFANMNQQEQKNVLAILENRAHKINIESLKHLQNCIQEPTLTPWLVQHGACWAYSVYQMPALKVLMHERETTWKGCTLGRELLHYKIGNTNSTEHPWLKTVIEIGLADQLPELLHPKTTILRHNGQDLTMELESLDLETSSLCNIV